MRDDVLRIMSLWQGQANEEAERRWLEAAFRCSNGGSAEEELDRECPIPDPVLTLVSSLMETTHDEEFLTMLTGLDLTMTDIMDVS